MQQFRSCRALGVLLFPGLLFPESVLAAPTRPPSLDPVHASYPAPILPFDEPAKDEEPDDTLEAALAEAFATNPDLAARRYDLRATDDEVGIALAQTRPTVTAQVSGGYEIILPGTTTQAARPLSDRLNNPNIERNDLTSQLVVEQPLYTGGRARGALRTALAGSAVGRATLRGAEGDMLVELIAAYCDVRRDNRSLAIRRRNVAVLEATLDEVSARREAGELTRTDIAQAETQLLAARVQLNAAESQLEASRAAFAAIVGREPGVLAPAPQLPNLPPSADEAFAQAELANPDLAAAIATQRVSAERIASARAEGRPELSLRGTAGTNGPAIPFDRAEHDVTFAGRLTLSIPLVSGGRVRAAVAQARNRESADALRVEATRRQMVQSIINAWNQWVTASRNAEAQRVQIQAARIYYEGTYQEYREGLRSTFDVLYAQNALRDTEIALLASERDRYVAQAVLLRQLGLMEADKLLAGGPTYDPDAYLKRVRNRSAVPWGPTIRALDSVGAPSGKSQAIEMPEMGGGEPKPAPAMPVSPPDELLRGAPAPIKPIAPSSKQGTRP